MRFQSDADGAGESGWRETVRIVVHALILAMIVRVFFYQPFNIPSGSMKSTLLVGDYLFVSKLSYGYSRYSFPFGIIPFQGRVFFVAGGGIHLFQPFAIIDGIAKDGRWTVDELATQAARLADVPFSLGQPSL